MTAPKHPCVYMLRCGNGSLYTGWTDDLPKRLAAHQSGRGARYTRAFGVQGLAYVEPQPDKGTALRREAALKKLTKAQKEALAAAWAQQNDESRCRAECVNILTESAK